MDIKTESGIKVSVARDLDAKILMFDKPVRILSLTELESRRLSASLNRDSKIRLTGGLRDLITNGFFKKEKKFSEIKGKLKSEGLKVKSGSLSVVLEKLVDRGELMREGKRRSYKYSQPT